MLKFGVPGNPDYVGGRILRSSSDQTGGVVSDSVDALLRGPSFMSQEQLQEIRRVDGLGKGNGIYIGEVFIERSLSYYSDTFQKLSVDDWSKIFDVLGLTVNIEQRENDEIHISMSSEAMVNFKEFMDFYFGKDISKPVMGGINVKTRIARRDGTYYGLCFCF